MKQFVILCQQLSTAPGTRKCMTFLSFTLSFPLVVSLGLATWCGVVGLARQPMWEGLWGPQCICSC